MKASAFLIIPATVLLFVTFCTDSRLAGPTTEQGNPQIVAVVSMTFIIRSRMPRSSCTAFQRSAIPPSSRHQPLTLPCGKPIPWANVHLKIFLPVHILWKLPTAPTIVRRSRPISRFQPSSRPSPNIPTRSSLSLLEESRALFHAGVLRETRPIKI